MFRKIQHIKDEISFEVPENFILEWWKPFEQLGCEIIVRPGKRTGFLDGVLGVESLPTFIEEMQQDCCVACDINHPWPSLSGQLLFEFDEERKLRISTMNVFHYLVKMLIASGACGPKSHEEGSSPYATYGRLAIVPDSYISDFWALIRCQDALNIKWYESANSLSERNAKLSTGLSSLLISSGVGVDCRYGSMVTWVGVDHADLLFGTIRYHGNYVLLDFVENLLGRVNGRLVRLSGSGT